VNGTRLGAGERARIYASTTATYDEAADLDLIAIEYALNGEPASLTLAEKIYAAQLLDSRGLTVQGWKTNGWQLAPMGRKPNPTRAAEAGRERAA
jgi:hypothetical protein